MQKEQSGVSKSLWQEVTSGCHLSERAISCGRLRWRLPPVAESLPFVSVRIQYETAPQKRSRPVNFGSVTDLHSYHSRPEIVSSPSLSLSSFFPLAFDLFTKNSQLGYTSFLIHQALCNETMKRLTMQCIKDGLQRKCVFQFSGAARWCR